MLQIQCTQKIFKLFEFAPDNLPKKTNTTILGIWYASIRTFWDNDFLLLVNDATLYAIPIHIPNVSPQIDIAALFKDNLLYFLIADEITESYAHAKIAELEPTIFTKTTSRGILGTMNNLNQIMYVYIERELEDSGSINMLRVQNLLNRIPQRTIGWKYAVETMREHLLNK